jgi:hypothetical protein
MIEGGTKIKPYICFMKKQIIGFEGLYEIDQYGNVYSIARKGTKGGKISLIQDEYFEVVLCKKSKMKRFSLHRLIAIHFIDNPNNYDQVNHIDGNKFNNDISNLEWCNNSQNQLHAYKNKLRIPAFGSRNGNSKLNEDDIREIRNVASSSGRYYGRKQLAEKYNISEAHIKDIVTKRKNIWNHVC